MFNNLRELFDYINNYYGERNMWISDLAADLGICNRNANHLVYAAGYRRGKRIVTVSVNEFAADLAVQDIFKLLK